MGTLRILNSWRTLVQIHWDATNPSRMQWLLVTRITKGCRAYSEASMRNVVRGTPPPRHADEANAEKASLVYCILQKKAGEKSEPQGVLADYLIQQEVLTPTLSQWVVMATTMSSFLIYSSAP